MCVCLCVCICGSGWSSPVFFLLIVLYCSALAVPEGNGGLGGGRWGKAAGVAEGVLAALVRRADDRPNKASQGLGPSLSALPPRCPLCSLLPPRFATPSHSPPTNTCGPALMGPSWTSTFSLLQIPALFHSVFSPRWHTFSQDVHCLRMCFSFSFCCLLFSVLQLLSNGFKFSFIMAVFLTSYFPPLEILFLFPGNKKHLVNKAKQTKWTTNCSFCVTHGDAQKTPSKQTKNKMY